MKTRSAPSPPAIVRAVDDLVPRREVDRVGRGDRTWQLGVVTVLLLAVLTMALPSRPAPVEFVDLSVDVVLADSGMTIPDLVGLVQDAAEGAGLDRPVDELTVILTDEVPDTDERPFVGGRQVDSTVWVRVTGLALPSRTVLHEVAHAFTPGDGHGEHFREVYLAAVTEVYGQATAAREERRLAWVYDRCYLDDSCPQLDARDPFRS